MPRQPEGSWHVDRSPGARAGDSHHGCRDGGDSHGLAVSLFPAWLLFVHSMLTQRVHLNFAVRDLLGKFSSYKALHAHQCWISSSPRLRNVTGERTHHILKTCTSSYVCVDQLDLLIRDKCTSAYVLPSVSLCENVVSVTHVSPRPGLRNLGLRRPCTSCNGWAN